VEFNYDKTVMAAKTKRFMEAGTENIAEASFCIDGLYCAVDILHKNGEGYDIIEVKSTTKVKDIHIDDMAFQHYVLKRCGVDVQRVFLMHINNAYVRQGELDLQQLFTLEEFTDVVKEKYNEVEENIKSIRAYVDTETEPQRDIDLYCKKPYDCAFYKYCAKHVPEQSIFSIRDLWKTKKYQYYHQGIISFADIIKKQPKLNEKQWRQVNNAYYEKADDFVNIRSDITMTVTKVEGNTVYIKLENNSDDDFSYSESFSLQKEIDGSWYRMPDRLSNYVFNSILIRLPAHESVEQKCDITKFGEL
jgi:predicted RecB family nuclease